MKIRLRITAFLILMSAGWVLSTIGVLAYWLARDIIKGYAVIPMAILVAFFALLDVSVAIGQYRNDADHVFVASLLTTAGFAIGFVIPLWLTGFAFSTFQAKTWNFTTMLVLAVAGILLIAKEWAQKDAHKQASLFPYQGD